MTGHLDTAAAEQRGRMARAELRCEGLVAPLGIDTLEPGFSWTVEAAERGERQGAYQVVVGRDLRSLAHGVGDVWDSGKVASAVSVGVAYAGAPLKSRTRYGWRVRLWDARAADLGWSGIATFETALLNPSDWSSAWIGGRILRRAFEVAAELRMARLYVSGLGWSEIRLNGEKVGEHVLDPGQTDYDARVPYVTYDLTSALREGRNVLGVLLGRGRYAQTARLGTFPFRRYGVEPVLRAQLHLRYADDREEVVLSDGGWLLGESPIVADDIYDGETYDARIEVAGWDHPSTLEPAGWIPATLAEGPSGRMVSCPEAPPIRVVARRTPLSIREPRPGIFVFDFGQTFTGWVKLRVRGRRGTRVTLRFAEVLDRDGMLATAPNRRARATDSYTLSGNCEEIWEPRFTYHSFRYVEVCGYPGVPGAASLEGCVVRTDVPDVGAFSCSDPLLRRIQEAIRWTLTSNLMSIPTDCAARDERMGWMGDAHLVAEVNSYNFDMAGFYGKFTEDMIAAQAPDGAQSDVVPPYWRLYPSDPTWGAACVIIPWTAYLFSGDRRRLGRAFPMGRRFLDHALGVMDGGPFPNGKFGDWAPPSSIPSLETPASMVATWHVRYCAVLLAKMARALNRVDEAAELDAIADRIATIYNRAYLDGDWYAGETQAELAAKLPVKPDPNSSEAQQRETFKRLLWLFAPPAQTPQLLALAAGIVPDEKRDEVVRGLLYNVAELRAAHVGTGIVGTKYLLDVLTELGEGELAFHVATQTTYPSWGHMLREGATTLWERWEYLDGPGMNTHNQAMFATIGAWFFRVLAGIAPDEAGPGFERVTIRPRLLGDLKWASASLRTVRGQVNSAWTRDGSAVRLEISLPNNTSGVVSVPKLAAEISICEGGMRVWDSGRFVAGVEGVTEATDLGDHVEISLGAGDYVFTSAPS